MDIVYRPRRTPLLAAAAAAGARTVDGLQMLLHQGALAFTLWTGRQAPLAAMRRALARPRPRAPSGARNRPRSLTFPRVRIIRMSAQGTRAARAAAIAGIVEAWGNRGAKTR